MSNNKDASETLNWRRRYLKKLAGNPFNYVFGYVTDSTMAIFLIYVSMKQQPKDLIHIVLWMSVGFFIWGFSEYFIHRYPYHHGETLVKEGHDLHHEEPQAPYAMPWYFTIVYIMGGWYLLIKVLPLLPTSSFLSGWLFGFMYFRAVHYFQHNRKLKSRFYRKLKAFHDVHHKYPATNFGVTITMWDAIFRTKYKKQDQ